MRRDEKREEKGKSPLPGTQTTFAKLETGCGCGCDGGGSEGGKKREREGEGKRAATVIEGLEGSEY